VVNRQDIIVKNKTVKTCLLTDVAVPSDRNVIQKEAEKELKYKYISTQIHRTWNMKYFVESVMIRATGIATKGLQNICKQYQESIQ